MRILRTLLVKEFKQIFRNRFILPVIFVVPLVQMIILTYAASLEMKDIHMAVVDEDGSALSRQLISKFSGSPFFNIEQESLNFKEATDLLVSDRVDVVLHFGSRFERRMYREQATDLQLVVNAINATEAGLVNAYCNRIIADYNREIRSDLFGLNGDGSMVQLEMIPRFWYNPLLDYKIYMFSGILVIIVTLIGMLLTALNLVREKEMGTTEQI
ncbi:MAG: ABC transporter permease, partial [Bacteroidales bacterium]